MHAVSSRCVHGADLAIRMCYGWMKVKIDMANDASPDHVSDLEILSRIQTIRGVRGTLDRDAAFIPGIKARIVERGKRK